MYALRTGEAVPGSSSSAITEIGMDNIAAIAPAGSLFPPFPARPNFDPTLIRPPKPVETDLVTQHFDDSGERRFLKQYHKTRKKAPVKCFRIISSDRLHDHCWASAHLASKPGGAYRNSKEERHENDHATS